MHFRWIAIFDWEKTQLINVRQKRRPHLGFSQIFTDFHRDLGGEDPKLIAMLGRLLRDEE